MADFKVELDTGKELPQAPIGAPVTKEREFDKECILDATAWTKKSVTLDELLSEELKGCGTANLIKMTVDYEATAKDQYIYMGWSPTGSLDDAKMLSRRPGGVRLTGATSDQVRKTVHIEFKYDDRLARRIKPAHPDLQMAQLVLDKSSNLDLCLTLYVKIDGYQTTFRTLN